MANREIRISKLANGNVRIADDILSSEVGFGERMDGSKGLWYNGNCDPWSINAKDYTAEIEPLIMATLADGEARTFVVPAEPAKPSGPEWKSPRGKTLAEEMDSPDSDY